MQCSRSQAPPSPAGAQEWGFWSGECRAGEGTVLCSSFWGRHPVLGENFFKGRKTNQKKRELSPAFRTCLLLGYLISAEEAGTEARFLLAVSKRNSGFAFDLASPEHEALRSARRFDGAAQEILDPYNSLFLQHWLKFPLEVEGGARGPRVEGGLINISEKRAK